MEVIPQNPLIKVSQEYINKIRKDFDLDVRKINDNIDAIQEWLKKEDHLKEAAQYLDRFNFECFHILGRGSVEETKNRIERIFTARALVPELVLNKNVEEFDTFFENVTYIILPNVSQRCGSRILLTKLVNENSVEHFDLMTYLRFMIMLGEFRLHYEYCMQDRYVIDLKHVNLSIITKINPVLMKKAEILATKTYGLKIKGIHLLNAPPFVDKIIHIFKQALREKIANRIYVHHSLEELHKEISKEVLPADYGGEELSCDKLAAKWKEYLKTEDASRILKISNNLYSDESKRVSTKFNEEYLGMPGSFKFLTVD